MAPSVQLNSCRQTPNDCHYFLDWVMEKTKTKQAKKKKNNNEQRLRFFLLRARQSTARFPVPIPFTQSFRMHRVNGDAGDRRANAAGTSAGFFGGSDSSELVPEAGRHEAFHLVCEKSQGCKECAEELRGSKKGKKTEII